MRILFLEKKQGTCGAHPVVPIATYDNKHLSHRLSFTLFKAEMILDLKMAMAHSKATSQKISIIPEDWTPFLRSSWIKKVASSCKREVHSSLEKPRRQGPTVARSGAR